MNVPCPTCAKPSSLEASNPWRPFCSERCRLIDLGGWLDERYSIPGGPAQTEEPADDHDHGSDDDPAGFRGAGAR